MTKLIPLDAAIACLTETFKGIGEREIDALDGWWETSSECDFGEDRLNTAIIGLQSIPTIDPAAIREAALWDLLEEIDAQIDLAEEISPEFAEKVQLALWTGQTKGAAE